MKDESYHLAILKQYMKDRTSVPREEVLKAVIYFRHKRRPDFIPENIWKIMLSWG